jgi:benzoyl-CoA-dihydrodiol lyase
LPEVPLLGVLPGTGGLTRLVDKRKVRRDVADVFCTKAEGFRLRDALKMRLVDGGWPKSKWDAELQKRAASVVAAAGGPGTEQGIALTPLQSNRVQEAGVETWRYPYVTAVIDPSKRQCVLTVHAPTQAPAQTAAELQAQGDQSWALAAFRQLDEALLELRLNHPTIGLLLWQTSGDAQQVLAHDTALSKLRAEGCWLAREIQLHQARVLRRADNMAKSMFALIQPGSAFAGVLAELVWVADRSYMLDDPETDNHVWLHDVNFGAFTMHNGTTRLQTRFLGEPAALETVQGMRGAVLAADAAELGLVTRAPDDIDWEDEVRIAIEERISYSPDALTGMEQNLRFAGAESPDTKLFGRLTAWQNWIFQRPNAVGERGALVMFGDPRQPIFDYQRT